MKSLKSTKSGSGSPKLPKKVENDVVMVINDISDGGTNSSGPNLSSNLHFLIILKSSLS